MPMSEAVALNTIKPVAKCFLGIVLSCQYTAKPMAQVRLSVSP